MEITGRIYDALPIVTGNGQNGEWKKQGFVLLTTGQNPQYFYFDVFDGKYGKLARYNIKKGLDYTVWFDVRAHEYNGRWFNQVIVKDVRLARKQKDPQQQSTGLDTTPDNG